MLSCFHLIPEGYGRTDRQTDGQTDRFAISISRVTMLTRDKSAQKSVAATYISIIMINESNKRKTQNGYNVRRFL